ncbi:peritrophin-44 [Drosophila serrata]|uniref:peritrophin-44 n=1 Tax=Drosophila serrata TaxID=7274 RepID=UPI000A1D16ED|nr:peritrophin-44 [Drosophila serrata]
MRVPQCHIHVVLLLAFFIGIRAYSLEVKCQLLAGKGYIGDPSDCQAWAYCEDNRLIDRRSCSEGSLFNFRDGSCKKASQAKCHSNLSEICSQLRPGDYAADPTNCRRFVSCEAREDASGGDCGEDQVFSNKLQTCVAEISGCPQNNICSLMKDGLLLADPQTCNIYYKCHNGFATSLNCSAGRYFNRITGHCQSWLPEHCSKDDETVPAIPPTSNSHICAKFYQPDRSGMQSFPDLMTCYGYYTCTSPYDVGKWNSCPWGTHFQWWSESCASPEGNSCSYDRCGNMNRLMVATINTGCREYTVCRDYRSTKSEKCPGDYPYFNELSGQCSRQFPNHRVCYMNG